MNKTSKSNEYNMIRVSQEYPCPVCGKPDWCLRDREGHKAYCMRIEQGSHHSFIFQDGNVCYVHYLDVKHKAKRIPWIKITHDKKYAINWEALQEFYVKSAPDSMVKKYKLAEIAFGRGWDSEAITYPMYNSDFEIVGMSRRFSDNKKCVVKGSTPGLFMPTKNYRLSKWVLICEGLSDAIAGLELGFMSIGKFNCNTCSGDILRLFDLAWSKKVPIIIADNDKPGIRGAEKLQILLLEKIKKSSIVIIPPFGTKDLQDWKKNSLTNGKLYDIIKMGLKWISTGKQQNEE